MRVSSVSNDGNYKQSKDGELDYDEILQQVEQEFQLCLSFMRPKVDEWLRRLKLNNNQVREKTRVGDPLLYTIHQTVLASLYSDKLQVEFKPREEGDEYRAENLNSVYEYDRAEMQKDIHDYQWDWDASFFGRGLSLFNNFDTETNTPIPEILDPTTFLRDPMAISVNGNRSGNGGLRFSGWETYLTRAEMDENDEYFNLDDLRYGNDELTSLTGRSRRARQEAQGLATLTNWENLTTNYKYGILRWLTHIKGEKYLVELGNNRTCVIRCQKLPWKYWPIIDRPFSPVSHDWDGVSIPDIIEDKQRFRANIINVAGDLVKADLNGMYIYRGTGFRKNQDFNFKFGKWIEYNGDKSLADAAAPLQMKQVSNGAKFILDFLDLSAQKAAATPDLQQGAAQKGAETLGENNLIVSGSENRYSLTAKVFGWSEKAFAMQYYRIYQEYFADGLGRKMARLEGAFGRKWAGKDGDGLTRGELIMGNTMGPDIEVESKVMSEAKKMRQLNEVALIEPLVLQDPQADQMYYKRKKAKFIFPRDEVERIFPLTIDELQAREENENLSDGKYVPVEMEQNHVVHLRENNMAKDGPAKDAHLKAHRFMLMAKRQAPHLFPPMPEDNMAANMQGQNTKSPEPLNAPTPVASSQAQPMQ